MLHDEELAKKGFRAIEDFVEFRQKSVGLVKAVFQNEQLQTLFLTKAVNEGFSDFLNIEPNIVAEFLAKFLDFHLKKVSGQVGISDEELIKVIDEVLILFRIVKAKDIFEEFYQRGLSRRLLLKKSASYDSEKMMIMKLKTECGDQFITKVQGMIRDLHDSDRFMQEYKKVKGEDKLSEASGGIDLHFHVLSSNNWPISQSITCNIPKQIVGCHEMFENYYKSRNQGKMIKFCI